MASLPMAQNDCYESRMTVFWLKLDGIVPTPESNVRFVCACDLGAMGCACCQESIPTLQKEIGQYHAKYMRIEGAGGHESLKAHYLKEIDRRMNKIVAHPKFKELPWSGQQWYLQETGKIPKKKEPGFDWNTMQQT